MPILKKIHITPKIVFFTLLFLSLIGALRFSFDAGISADEFRHHEQAEKVYNYFKSGGEDKSALKNTGNDPMQYNGQSFDNAMYFIEKQLDIKDYMTLRHFFNAIIGWLIILITGLIVKEITGYPTAILAVILLFISPRFIGHIPNNNKDIPFAFGFILSIYGILLFLKQLPKPSFKTLLILTLGIAYSISIRMAGILSICFLGLYSAIYYITYPPILSPFSKEKRLLITRLIIYILPIVIISYFLGIVTWPFMLESPIKNIPVIFKAMSAHPLALNQLFEGDVIWSNSLPWYYILKYIYITYPLIIFCGIVLFLGLYLRYWKLYVPIQILVILFSLLFVLVWMSYENSNIYNGIRHLLFIYPLVVIVSSLGLSFLYKLLSKYIHKPSWKYVFVGLVIIMSYHPMKHLILNYPYAYIYFNELSGGIKKAYGNYETDYFQHSLKHASEWLIDNELNKKNSNDISSIKIITNEASNVGYYFHSYNDKIEVEYTRYYEKSRKYWDYGIFYCSYIDPYQLKNNLWPPAGTIHTEEVDGIPIAAVVKRVSYDDFNGFQTLGKKQLKKAREYFLKYLETNPNNEEVYDELSRIETDLRNYEKANEYADKALELHPNNNISVCSMKGIIANDLKDYKTALGYLNKAIDIKKDYHIAHYNKGFSLYMLDKPNDALKSLEIATNIKKDYYEAHLLIGDILLNYGQAKDAEEHAYEQILTYKENDFVTKVRLAYCYYYQNELQKSKDILEEVGRIDSYNFDIVKLRTRIDIAEGNMDRAGKYLNMMRRINNNSDLFVVRALFDLKQKNIESAKANLDKAIELFTNNGEAKRILSSLNTPPKKKQNQSTQSIMLKKEKPKNKSNLFNM